MLLSAVDVPRTVKVTRCYCLCPPLPRKKSCLVLCSTERTLGGNEVVSMDLHKWDIYPKKRRSEGICLCCLPWDNAVRTWRSISQEGSPHQEPDMLAF